MRAIIIPLLLLFFTQLCAQQESTIFNYSVINKPEWIIPRNDTLDYSLDKYLGQNALIMKRKFPNYKSASVAYPKNLKFKDGIIEMDAAWPGKANGFVGVAFRIRDAHHYETVYFRPESSGTINAMQYMPENKPDFNWWDYESNKYQANTILPLHGWFHVKIIVKGSNLSVFVNHRPKPIFSYNNLDSSLKSGSVGYWLGNSTAGAYKNLIVTNL